MIPLNIIKQARHDEKLKTMVYRHIFYDNKDRPKVRRWLITKGLKYELLDDVIGDFNLIFCKLLNEYNDEKIPFEKYVWTKFSYHLIDIATKYNKRKKRTQQVYIDDTKECDVLGELKINDFKFDYTQVLLYLTKSETKLLKYLLRSYGKKEIINAMNITTQHYNRLLHGVKTVVRLYVEGEL